VIDFEIPTEVEELRERVREFVATVAIPAEARDVDPHGISPKLRTELQVAAKEAGVFAPQLPPNLGGHGLDMRSSAVILERGGLRATRAARAELCRARRGQHAHARSHRRP
jgi:acyl-CoA dehydrogenase